MGKVTKIFIISVFIVLALMNIINTTSALEKDIDNKCLIKTYGLDVTKKMYEVFLDLGAEKYIGLSELSDYKLKKYYTGDVKKFRKNIEILKKLKKYKEDLETGIIGAKLGIETSKGDFKADTLIEAGEFFATLSDKTPPQWKVLIGFYSQSLKSVVECRNYIVSNAENVFKSGLESYDNLIANNYYNINNYISKGKTSNDEIILKNYFSKTCQTRYKAIKESLTKNYTGMFNISQWYAKNIKGYDPTAIAIMSESAICPSNINVSLSSDNKDFKSMLVLYFANLNKLYRISGNNKYYTDIQGVAKAELERLLNRRKK